VVDVVAGLGFWVRCLFGPSDRANARSDSSSPNRLPLAEGLEVEPSTFNWC
jgi:hypothetical protein